MLQRKRVDCRTWSRFSDNVRGKASLLRVFFELQTEVSTQMKRVRDTPFGTEHTDRKTGVLRLQETTLTVTNQDKPPNKKAIALEKVIEVLEEQVR